MFSLILSLGLCVAVMCIVGFGIVRNLPQRRRTAIAHLLGMLLFFGALLNGVIYWHVAVFIGGNAVSGKIDNGRYFVSSHGKLTEVSEATWRYSYVHHVSTWITHPLAGIGMLLLYWTDERKKPVERPHDSVPSA